MGSKNKLKRFNQNLTFKNVIQPTREELVENKFALKGNWNKVYFKNDPFVEGYEQGWNIKGINEYGSGGMQTKIEAAKICQLAGCSMIIANGLYTNPISRIIDKNYCTWFSSKVSKLDARKKWIISSIAPKGSIIIDDGAKKALRSGKSLLAAGIKKISGKFNKGDHVKILDKKNNECARGLSSFTSDEIVKIMGNHSNQIEKLLGYVAKSEVIHKDDMVEI